MIIKLTRPNGTEVWVNSDVIVDMTTSQDGTTWINTVGMNSEGRTRSFTVTESPDEIASRANPSDPPTIA